MVNKEQKEEWIKIALTEECQSLSRLSGWVSKCELLSGHEYEGLMHTHTQITPCHGKHIYGWITETEFKWEQK